ncbi:FecR family protein [Sphingomonas nostoxanthinifaciens]|uniref:FecR family protein n=1 Tax=Sphingomonas nostoxanthinifaciens TaxID=2872652 RepID=UPI001CC21DBF|nr:FecR domain-containing protein [Sphingomonas nostoxanthinifaciens]UAK23059.1 FecR domain-containing protein [Sphingomonas nostoxanthinifaciens]
MSLTTAILSLLLQTSGTDAGGMAAYTIRPGDTRAGVASVLIHPADLDAVLRANGAPTGVLQAGRTVRFPMRLLRQIPLRASVVAVRGDVHASGLALTRPGARLGEGTLIVTGADSAIGLRLPDGSVVTLPSASRIRIERLRRTALTRIFDRRFSLEAGRSEYNVVPNHRFGSRFEIRTPVSVAAVRGTIFRVSLPDSASANAEVLRGEVGVQGRVATISLPKGFGAHSDVQSAGTPIELLPAPEIERVSTGADGGEAVELGSVPGAVRYRVQLSPTPDFVSLLAEQLADAPSVNLKATPFGVYYLRATAIDSHGLEGLPDVVQYEHKSVLGSRPTGK